jgi:hypothetical protein
LRALQRITMTRRALVLDAGGGVRTALIGGFMVIAGPQDVLDSIRGASGSVLVDDLGRAERDLREAGAEITMERREGPLGEFLYARHPDGTLFEYAAFDPELVAARSASALATHVVP